MLMVIHKTQKKARMCVYAGAHMHVWHEHTYGCLHALVLTGGGFIAEGSFTLVFISLQLLMSLLTSLF